MTNARVLIAKVALRIASEHEARCVRLSSRPDVRRHIDEIRRLAYGMPTTPMCISNDDLIDMADLNRITLAAQEHLIGCRRCASIGQYVFSIQMDDRRAETALSAI